MKSVIEDAVSRVARASHASFSHILAVVLVSCRLVAMLQLKLLILLGLRTTASARGA
jgi:hypothetical protein